MVVMPILLSRMYLRLLCGIRLKNMLRDSGKLRIKFFFF